MRKIYHFPICPLSRQVRLIFKELNLEFELIYTEYWLKSPQLLNLNPHGELPIIYEGDGRVIYDIYAIIEYINSVYSDRNLMGENYMEALKIRQKISWFNNKFYFEVTKPIIDEKMIRVFTREGSPESSIIRNAKNNLKKSLEFLNNLLQYDVYIAGEQISYADFVAAAHISSLDFLNDIMWEDYPEFKHWYSLMKSRPSFRPFLIDRIIGFTPPKHYTDLDF